MTVCTNDLAPADLVEDGLPTTVADAFGDVEALVAARSAVVVALAVCLAPPGKVIEGLLLAA
jgi:hypothetical protein